MKKYDYKKAKEIIATMSGDITSASLGMQEDWFWTAETVFEDGDYTKDLDSTVNIAGINGSNWATPALLIEYKNGAEEFFDCFTGESDSDANPLAGALGVLSGPCQERVDSIPTNKSLRLNPTTARGQDMNSNTKFEFIAEAFRIDTGYMRPGKDDALGAYSHEEREAKFVEWFKENERMINVFCKAASNIIDDPF